MIVFPTRATYHPWSSKGQRATSEINIITFYFLLNLDYFTFALLLLYVISMWAMMFMRELSHDGLKNQLILRLKYFGQRSQFLDEMILVKTAMKASEQQSQINEKFISSNNLKCLIWIAMLGHEKFVVFLEQNFSVNLSSQSHQRG